VKLHVQTKTCVFLMLSGVFVVLQLAACGGGGKVPTATPTATSSTTSAVARLQHMPKGMAMLDWTPNHNTLAVQLTLTGLAPSSTHPAHIHMGSCAKQGGIMYPLPNVVADKYGNATMKTDIANVKGGIPAIGWFINVHNGPGLSPADQYQPIACGDIVNPHPSTSQEQKVQVPLNGILAANSNQAANGMAKLTVVDKKLIVLVTLTGLAPNSVHAAHIHSGSCDKEGPVIHPLTNVTADSHGNATTTTTIPNVSSIPNSGWYVNVHNTTTLTNQTGFDPIACGNLTPG
jgi:hypothetical protein